MTLDTASGKWWAEVGTRRRDADAHFGRVGRMLDLVGRARTLAEIDHKVVAEAIEKRRGQAFRRSAAVGAKAYLPSNTTVNRDVIDCLRPILRRARTHWTPKGTPSGLPEIAWDELRLEEPRETVKVYEPDEQARWLDEARRTGWYAGRTPRRDAADVSLALELLLTYGLRLAELYFPPAIFRPDAAELDFAGADRKLGVPHKVPLLPRHVEALKPLVATAKLHKLEHVWFWLDKKGRPQPIPPNGLVERLNNAADRAGVQAARRIHGGRHHAGTAFYRATKDLKLTQDFLGHADPASTLRYVHADPSAVRAAIEGIDAGRKAAPPAGQRKRSKR